MNKALIPITVTAVLTAGVAALAGPVDASRPDDPPVVVTHGRFETLPGGDDLGFDVRGSAVMVRNDADGGSTTVTVRVSGLEPGLTYKTHVHDQPCSSVPAGGGHYQNEIGGAVDDVNEIWPTLIADAKGKAVGRAEHGHWAREDARAIVIHWSESTAVRLACVDLW